MSRYPEIPRCQHIKVNGTQCGSPALQRKRFCYFHQRWHETRIVINSRRARQARAAIDLPVLEDANSIQISLMQVMRLILTGQIEAKTAGLLLYTLQTASINLKHTRFEPRVRSVVVDPRAVEETPLGEDPVQQSEDGDAESVTLESLGIPEDELRATIRHQVRTLLSPYVPVSPGPPGQDG